jgi:hypothetical protein
VTELRLSGRVAMGVSQYVGKQE